MTSKQIVSLFKNNQNLCEIALEYPSINYCTSPRHLCTCTEPIKLSGHVRNHILTTNITTEPVDHKTKTSDKHSKRENEETEVIKLFHDNYEAKINRKSRYQSIKYDD